ncbi:hypothetical protein KC614_00870 [candidate division WWE3 bacterium]|uniref:Uncharacterized protein n=1 Tax=candidate division WWE3 bacterium TaxID=2053526 RepID=A0A955LJ89_UNCKA|nr:hypothetical protein [candidate division WWE3 bacterium]
MDIKNILKHRIILGVGALVFVLACFTAVYKWHLRSQIAVPNLADNQVVAAGGAAFSNSKFDIDSVTYLQYDSGNCDPKTLKKAGTNDDCFLGLPAIRNDYYYGSFGSQLYFLWSDLQSGVGQYNWTRVDTALQQASSMAIQDASGNTVNYKPVTLSVAFYLDEGGTFKDYTPQFIKGNVVDPTQLKITAVGCADQEIPAYGDSYWQQQFQAFITAFAEHIKQSSYKDIVQAVYLSTGLSDESTPTVNQSGCAYKTTFVNDSTRMSAYNNYVLESLQWYKNAYQEGSGLAFPLFLQAAAASSNLRSRYSARAQQLGIGIKLNGLAPASENSFNTKVNYDAGGKGGFYDFVAMTPLTLPHGFEPYYWQTGPDNNHCSSTYCYSDARYQVAFWDYINSLELNGDVLSFQGEFFARKYRLIHDMGLTWFDELLEDSIGKTPNQSPNAWIAFADVLSEYDSIPPSSPPPAVPGSGNYYPYEFTERGDKDFYLYRPEATEDTSLIRNQGGVLADGQENYSTTINNCAYDIPNNNTRFITGSQLQSSYLDGSQLSHPFSAGARATDMANDGYYMSFVVDNATGIPTASSVNVTVNYLDSGTGTFSLEYEDETGNVRRQTVQKNDSGLWKEKMWNFNVGNGFVLNDGLDGDTDFRLNCDCDPASTASVKDDDIFAMVRVVAPELKTQPLAADSRVYYCEPIAVPTPTPAVVVTPREGYIHPGIDIDPSYSNASANFVYSTHAGFVTYAGPAPAQYKEKGWMVQVETDLDRDNFPDVITQYTHLVPNNLFIADVRNRRLSYSTEFFLNEIPLGLEKLPYGFGPYVSRNQLLGLVGDSGSPGRRHIQYEIVTDRTVGDLYYASLDVYGCLEDPYIEACIQDPGRPGFFFPVNHLKPVAVRGPVYVNSAFVTPLPTDTPTPTPSLGPVTPTPTPATCKYDLSIATVNSAIAHAASEYNVPEGWLRAILEIEAIPDLTNRTLVGTTTFDCTPNTFTALGPAQIVDGTYNDVTNDYYEAYETSGVPYDRQVCDVGSTITPDPLRLSRCRTSDAIELMARVLLSKITPSRLDTRGHYYTVVAGGGVDPSEQGVIYDASWKYQGSNAPNGSTIAYVQDATFLLDSTYPGTVSGPLLPNPLKDHDVSVPPENEMGYADLVCNKLGGWGLYSGSGGWCPAYPP